MAYREKHAGGGGIGPVGFGGFSVKTVEGSVFRDNSPEVLRDNLKRSKGNRVNAIEGFMRDEAETRDLRDKSEKWTDALNAIPVCIPMTHPEVDETMILEGGDLALLKRLVVTKSASDPQRMRAMAGLYLQLRGMLFFPGQPVKSVDDVLR
jgi:hypothetical protein